MTISVQDVMQLTVTETLGGEFVGTDNTVTSDGMNESATLTASSTPPVTKYSFGRAIMTAGAGTIDLTSLPNADGVAAQVTFLGLKVNGWILHNPGLNNIAVTEGTSNGYPLQGASFLFTIRPGETFKVKGADVGTDVASGDRTIDISGTGSQYLEYGFVAG